MNTSPGTVSHGVEGAAWKVLAAVHDPEIPVVTIEELGILRDVRMHAGRLQIVITPTYNGCPAMEQIEDDVQTALAGAGLEGDVVTQLAPAWTTDWITPAARDKLRDYGIAPPQGNATHADSTSASSVVRLVRKTVQAAVPCPHCGSSNTTETSHFGSTACKALFKCLDCLEPFDHFKPY